MRSWWTEREPLHRGRTRTTAHGYDGGLSEVSLPRYRGFARAVRPVVAAEVHILDLYGTMALMDQQTTDYRRGVMLFAGADHLADRNIEGVHYGRRIYTVTAHQDHAAVRLRMPSV